MPIDNQIRKWPTTSSGKGTGHTREFAMQLLGLCGICGKCLLCGCEDADRMALSESLYFGFVWLRLFPRVKRHAFESGGAICIHSPVLSVFEAIAKTEIRPPVVEAIAIDVVNEDAYPGLEKKPVQLTLSASDGDLHVASSIWVELKLPPANQREVHLVQQSDSAVGEFELNCHGSDPKSRALGTAGGIWVHGHEAVLRGLSECFDAQAVDRLVGQAQVDPVVDELDELPHVVLARRTEAALAETVELLDQLWEFNRFIQALHESRIGVREWERQAHAWEVFGLHWSGPCLVGGARLFAAHLGPNGLPVVWTKLGASDDVIARALNEDAELGTWLAPTLPCCKLRQIHGRDRNLARELGNPSSRQGV